MTDKPGAENTMRSPSGDHAGVYPRCCVSLWTPEPSGRITYTSVYPGSARPRAEAKRMKRPSGAQSTCHPSPTPDRSTNSEPSALTMDMTWSPVRLELKAIRVPSGDQDGYSPPSVWGRRCCPEPSACMSESPEHRSPRPGGHSTSPGLAYAILDPSGDQAGDRPAVSRRCFVPSAFMTQISGSPLRSDRNAMREPSGDQDGSKSSPGLVVSLLRPVPSALTTYTSIAPWAPAEKAIRPESDMDPPPLLVPAASDADVVGDGRSCVW